MGQMITLIRKPPRGAAILMNVRFNSSRSSTEDLRLAETVHKLKVEEKYVVSSIGGLGLSVSTILSVLSNRWLLIAS